MNSLWFHHYTPPVHHPHEYSGESWIWSHIFIYILDKCNSIIVYVDKAVVKQPSHEHLIPAMSSLLQAIDDVSALQHLAFRQSVFARQVNIDSFLAFS